MKWTICGWLFLASSVAMAAVAPDKDKNKARKDQAQHRERVVRNGASIDYSISPVSSHGALLEGEFADVRFKLTDTAGQPLRASKPGAWMDMAQVIQGRGAEQKSCKDKISLYLKGAVGMRPMVDLNGYFVVLMNNDSSLSVVDPVVSMAGATSTLGSMMLKAPGADWVASPTQRRLYVSMPGADAVAVVDTELFKVVDTIEAGKTPLRVALQPDARLLWVGNNAQEASASGVTAIDTHTGKSVGFVATGKGHHEIAFTADSRRAFVGNRTSGTVTAIDTATRKVLAEIVTGVQPLAISYSALSRQLYVADGKEGRVAVIDTETLRVRTQVTLRAGLGPLRVTPDGRHALVLNSREDMVQVIDTSTNEHVQDIAVPGEPYQFEFSETFAYVRSLHSERVHMVDLRSLGKGRKPVVQSFTAGSQAPGAVNAAVIANGIAGAAQKGAVFVTNPADGSTYFYQEGMNAPSSNYRVHGSSPRAVTVVDRSLKEVSPGVFEGRVRLPAAGKYDVAFMLQQPQILHCFSAKAAENPRLATTRAPLKLEFVSTQRQFRVGDTAALRFRLRDGKTGEPLAGVSGIQALHFLAPGRGRTETQAVEIGDGVYEVSVPLIDAGAWYVHVAVPAFKLGYEKLPFFSLQASTPTDVAVAR
jgi:YVTN family beta-propeller protein